ncbi:SRPBCC family protein [Yinghuangia seranimata]|uniref:SRPBCC family protein n=1 Tax=Yinghuangia seranimata TaxID=408067 RepID=UPI00248C0C69|nr:SRPBCC family protein [Yinghuangia seranimata]MDI2127275.1 SRPBCC family protein [Yinghuangia seranimata]MDI2132220.1 SRPBCC family protein [Yinghuangia seranimata]
MGQVNADASRDVAGEPDAVFAALSDYVATRPKLLTEHFSGYEVREGGQGAGTVVYWRLQATEKRSRECLFDVTQPADRTLVETDRNSTMVTTWTVVSSGPGRSRVNVNTRWQGAGGVGGFFEKLFAPSGLRKIYDGVLVKLDETA